MNRVLRHLRWPAFLVAWGMLATAWAEPLYRLQSLREDRGITVGAFRVWPEIFLETRYDSNLFRLSDKELDFNDAVYASKNQTSPYEGILSAVIFRAMPSFECKNPNGRTVQFHFAGMGDLRAYYAGKGADYVKAQSKLGGNARMRVHLVPTHPFQAYVEDRFDRTLSSRNDVSKDTYTRVFNEAGAGVIARPGEALTFDLHYSLVRDVFVEFSQVDKFVHNVGLTGRWKFFPRTEAFFDGTVGFTRYDEPRMAAASATTAAVQVGNFDSSLVRAQAGLNGYLTRRIFVILGGGYGNSFHDKGTSYNGFLAKAMVGYEIPDTWILQGGYARSFEESLFANYYASDAIDLSSQVRLWGMVTFDVDAKFQFVNYGKPFYNPDLVYEGQTAPSAVGLPNRSDKVLTVKGAISLDFFRYFGMNVGGSFSDVMTDFYIENVGSGMRDYGAFSKFEIFANVVGRY